MLKQNGHVFIPLEFESLAAEEQLARAHEFEVTNADTAHCAAIFLPSGPSRPDRGGAAGSFPSPFRRQSAAVAICGGFRSRDQAEDSARGGNGRETEL